MARFNGPKMGDKENMLLLDLEYDPEEENPKVLGFAQLFSFRDGHPRLLTAILLPDQLLELKKFLNSHL